jgi:alpha-amylase
MGYDPTHWFNHNGTFGNVGELRSMTSAFKRRGTGILADVVLNHRKPISGWLNFANEYNAQDGKNYMLTSEDICANDDGGATAAWAAQNGYTLSPYNDEGDDFSDARDIAHQTENTQKTVLAYLDYLLNNIGYAGFRLDMVKGYSPYYTGLYNFKTKPQFSVGECWDGMGHIKWWMDQTRRNAQGNQDSSGDVQSGAFDFPLKWKLKEACESNNWLSLYPDDQAALIWDSYWPRWAVTFVDNHDTYREEFYRVNSNVLAANAFILAMPGTPCIFLPHWKQHKAALKKMIAARKAAGITNQSPITAQYELDGGYYLKVTGENGSVILTCGKPTGDIDLDQHTLVVSGENFAFYLWDGVYDEETYDEIEAESAQDICIYVRDNGQGAPYLYAWNGGTQFNGGWPGALMSDKVTLSDGTSWYKQTFKSSELNVIVTYDNGKQTQNIENITEDKYIVYYMDDDRKYADYSGLYNGDRNSDYIYGYFDAPTGWNKVWAWNDVFYDIENKNYTGGTWPGATMTKVGVSSTGNDIYRWRIDKDLNEGAPNHIIFNNGNGGQTTTLPFINGAYYDQNGIASENMLSFMPVALDGSSMVTATNWNGNQEQVAQGGANSPVTLRLYYPAGTYTVQAIVRGNERSDVTLTAGTSTASVTLTGMAADSPSTVTTDGVVEQSVDVANNGWQKVQTTFTTTENGPLVIRLTSDASTWQVGTVTLLKDADTQNGDKYQTTATTKVTETSVDVTDLSRFSFYGRGVNKNALVIASAGQAAAALPCNAVVDGQCSQLVLTDGAYDFAAPTDFTAESVTYDRSIAADKKVTVCLPFDVTAEEMASAGITAYEMDRVSPEGSFHFSPVNEMSANTPYIVVLSEESAPFASLSSKSISVTPDEIAKNFDGIQFTGTMKRMVLNSGDGAVYYGYKDGTFVKVGKNVGLNPFRAYIKSNRELGNAVKVMFDVSAIQNVTNEQKAATNTIYSIDGRIVSRDGKASNLNKGIYIQNGKKMVVK